MPFRLLDGFVGPPTREFLRQALARRDLSRWSRLLEALHGYIYLRFPTFYIGLALGRHPKSRLLRGPLGRLARFLGLWNEETGKSFADSYHGKVLPKAEATRLIRLDRPLDAVLPETVLPYGTARQIILENPLDLALFECPCRATMPNPCLPLDVCLIIGRPFVDFVLQHHPGKSRRIDAAEAAAVVEQAQRRGNVSHAFFKEAMLGRFYAVCNCCSCCCGAMQAFGNGVPMLASSGYLAVVDPASCVGCGLCAKTCHFGAIAAPIDETRLPRINPEACLGCGVCTLQCPTASLRLERAPNRPAPLLPGLDDPAPLPAEPDAPAPLPTTAGDPAPLPAEPGDPAGNA